MARMTKTHGPVANGKIKTRNGQEEPKNQKKRMIERSLMNSIMKIRLIHLFQLVSLSIYGGAV